MSAVCGIENLEKCEVESLGKIELVNLKISSWNRTKKLFEIDKSCSANVKHVLD